MPTCPGDHVVVSLPSEGLLAGDVVRRFQGSKLTGVVVGSTSGPVLEFVALLEGVPKHAVAGLLLEWNLRYGLPCHVLGDALALRLHLPVDRLDPGAAALLGAAQGLDVAATVFHADRLEQWFDCQSAAQAQRTADRLRLRLKDVRGALVETRSPTVQDLECWQVLRLAAEVSPPNQPIEA